ncbi:MAG: sensor domain-containing diguanylate cyclase [Blautia sp.]|nr:sensor domain-containing diguanylate cyclase [Blautia sp.]
MNNQTKSIVFQWLTPMAALIMILAIMMYNFSTKSRVSATNTVTRNMSTTAQTSVYGFEEELKLLQQVGLPIAALLDKETRMDSARAADLAQVALKYSGAYYVCTCDANGNGIDNTGKKISVPAEHLETVQEAQEVNYLYTANDEMEGEGAVIAVIPIGEEEVSDHLLLFYSLDNFESIIKKGDFAVWNIVTLIDEMGNIIFTSGEEKAWAVGDNLFDTLKAKNSNAITKMKRGITSGSSSLVTVQMGDAENALVYVPVETNDWTLVVGVTQAYIDRLVVQQYKSFQDMLYQMLLIIILFLCIIIGINIVGKLYGARKQKQLEVKADTDLLTGLNNKLATERKIKEYIAHNPGTQSMMFILDIDNFKKINDTMGHAFGDVVLRTLGHTIGALFRSTDIIGRAGGDEFILFIKDIQSPDIVRKEARKVEEFFKDFKAGEYTKYSATASIGVAIYPQEGADFESIYKAADQALYKAKKRGKNQLAFYKDEWAGDTVQNDESEQDNKAE